VDQASFTFTAMERPAITVDHLPQLIGQFYERLLADHIMAPYFAGIDLSTHMSYIARFWAMALFGAPGYHGDVMSVHVQLNARLPMKAATFERWLAHFDAALDAAHSGPKVEEAKQRARTIAAVMQHRMVDR
jgi:hemoglobin